MLCWCAQPVHLRTLSPPPRLRVRQALTRRRARTTAQAYVREVNNGNAETKAANIHTISCVNSHPIPAAAAAGRPLLPVRAAAWPS